MIKVIKNKRAIFLLCIALAATSQTGAGLAATSQTGAGLAADASGGTSPTTQMTTQATAAPVETVTSGAAGEVHRCHSGGKHHTGHKKHAHTPHGDHTPGDGQRRGFRRQRTGELTQRVDTPDPKQTGGAGTAPEASAAAATAPSK